MATMVGFHLFCPPASGRRRSALPHTVWPLGLLVALLLLACARGDRDLPDVGLELEIAPQPPQMGPATLTITLTDAANRPLEGAQVELEGNMSHAGMVPVMASAAEVAPGRYEAGLEFTMTGDWFILVRARLADGRSLERQVDVPAVGDVCITTPAPEADD